MSILQWNGPESKSVCMTMRRSRIKKPLYYNESVQNQRAPSHILLSPDLLLKILQKKNKWQSNAYKYMSCHSKFVPLCSTLNQNNAHNKLLFWGLGVYEIRSEYSLLDLYSSTIGVLVHAVQITTGPQYLTSSVSSSSSLITGLALERDFLFLELSDFSFFYNIQYIFTCITKHCLIQVVKGTKVWIIKSKIRIIQETIPFWTFLFCVSCW